ncbi:glycosyltransferase family 2 protein [Cerasicoccus arenae]|uniref:Glycosyltransferase 2-like domain-containing protein n=1 Tax=Cerasicoccus arenae TaxID=424488 RepID=A0A8J3DAI4_9BACT|nr:glycosyltransferase [Cerasicoccus arenae]MBK1857497.1 glycosyltransferase [Cerasicoccus arenae]GHB95361.1 hypothetical protein GCM10007047_08860 [Cerasicoccus arenae]
MTPAFTVLMPVLNAMPFLEECLDSFTKQSITNFNVYVWDNGSTDGTRECLKHWIPNRLPGKVFLNQPLPLGLSRAALIDESPTEACALMDADDRCLPNRFERQLAFWEKYPELAFFGSSVSLIDHTGTPINQAFGVPLTDLDIRCTLLRANAYAQNTIMLKKSAVQSVGNFRDRKCEDYDLQVRISAHHSIKNMPESTVEYRRHPASTSEAYGVDPGNQDFAIRNFAENAMDAYGISAENAYSLRCRQQDRAYPILKRIAQTIAKSSQCSTKSVFHNRCFRQAISWMVKPDDRYTQLRLMLHDHKDLNWLRRLKQNLFN